MFIYRVVNFCLEKNEHIFCVFCVLSSHDDSHGWN